jgi:hypothetical protein
MLKLERVIRRLMMANHYPSTHSLSQTEGLLAPTRDARGLKNGR